ncbi:hypothetical protein E2C01_051893 [Portunus trituberculatus]|uniref:Uncharacterized protein n=1 Tax=Portunus trituberculatus TaxID=210409 RepID=A0A5B7GKA0_PORTR|nr:hypothetical protein [Portunus trituberculatus]
MLGDASWWLGALVQPQLN